MSIIYNSPELLKLVKRWANTSKIRLKDKVSETDKYKKALKDFTKELSTTKIEFNKVSIDLMLDQILT